LGASTAKVHFNKEKQFQGKMSDKCQNRKGKGRRRRAGQLINNAAVRLVKGRGSGKGGQGRGPPKHVNKKPKIQITSVLYNRRKGKRIERG